MQTTYGRGLGGSMEQIFNHPARETIVGIPGQIFLLLIIAAGFALFAVKAYEAFRLIMKGRNENRLDNIPLRIKSLIVYVLAQFRVLTDPFAGLIHAFIFWGFLVLSYGYGNAIVTAFIPSLTFPVIDNHIFRTAHNIFSLLVIVSVLLALFRRLVLKPARLEYTTEALAILCLIFSIVSFDFISEGFKCAFTITTDSVVWFPPITAGLGGIFSGMGLAPETMHILSNLFWWLHMILIFSFMAYLPFSKHFHIVTAAINVFLRNLKPVGQLSKLDFENNSEYFGAASIKDYTWKDLLDLYACTECGRCSEHCPAHQTEKPLSPKKVIQDLKKHLKGMTETLLSAPVKGKEGEENPAELPAITGEVLQEDELWSCTTCGACMQACPVFIEHIPKIVETRRLLVQAESRFPQEVTLTFKNMENNYNPYGIGFSNRAEWCTDMGIRVLGECGKAEYLYWVGCVGSFDDRNKRVSQAIARLLKAAGIDFAILGAEEACCGDPARRTGNEFLYQTLVESNMEHFRNYGVKKIITHCPHCYNTLKNEYSQFGADFEVIHSTVLIAELIAKGKLSPENKQDKTLCYHDSCYLGRYNSIYNEPREILQKVCTSAPAEMKDHHESSFCCGAGGGRMWMEEKLGTRINRKRLDQALETKAEIISSNCPYCLTMLTDAVKDRNMEEKVQVLDVMELLERSCDKAREPEPAETSAS